MSELLGARPSTAETVRVAFYSEYAEMVSAKCVAQRAMHNALYVCLSVLQRVAGRGGAATTWVGAGVSVDRIRVMRHTYTSHQSPLLESRTTNRSPGMNLSWFFLPVPSNAYSASANKTRSPVPGGGARTVGKEERATKEACLAVCRQKMKQEGGKRIVWTVRGGGLRRGRAARGERESG